MHSLTFCNSDIKAANILLDETAQVQRAIDTSVSFFFLSLSCLSVALVCEWNFESSRLTYDLVRLK